MMMSKKQTKRALYIILFLSLPHLLLISGQPKLLYMLDLVGVYAIFAIAINLLVGFTGQISLGHAAFMAIGAYTSTLCTLKFHLPVPSGIILAGGISGLFGYLLGLPALRMKGHYLAILTLAFGFIPARALVHISSHPSSKMPMSTAYIIPRHQPPAKRPDRWLEYSFRRKPTLACSPVMLAISCHLR